MRAAGATGIPDDLTKVGDGVLGVWPDNWLPVQVFRRMLTQWTVGGTGAYVGLRYEALSFMLGVCGVPRVEWPEVVDCMQVMERHAVSLINESPG